MHLGSFHTYKVVIAIAAFLIGAAFYEVTKRISMTNPSQKRARLVWSVVLYRAFQQDGYGKSGKLLECTYDAIKIIVGAGSQSENGYGLIVGAHHYTLCFFIIVNLLEICQFARIVSLKNRQKSSNFLCSESAQYLYDF